MAVTLSIYLSHYPIRVMNPSIGAISKWKYLTERERVVSGLIQTKTVLRTGKNGSESGSRAENFRMVDIGINA